MHIDQPFRRLESIDQAAPDDIVIEIHRTGVTLIARLLLPAFLEKERPRYIDFKRAAGRARQIANEHDLGLAVTVDRFTQPDWRPIWDVWFGTASGMEAAPAQVAPTYRGGCLHR
jgi:hypothetical protein